MKPQNLSFIPLLLFAMHASAEFEAKVSSETHAIVSVYNTKENLEYSISDALSIPIDINFRGSCDTGKGMLTSFGLKLGGVNYQFPGIDGDNKSISGDHGASWATHTMSGQQVLPANNPFLIDACNEKLNKKSTTALEFDSVHLNIKTIPLYLNYTCTRPLPYKRFPNTRIADNLTLGVRCMASNYLEPIQEEPTAVRDLEFRIDKQSTIGGACKVNLKGRLNTSKPSQVVRFRYEHIDNSFKRKLSQIHQVTTNQNGDANFAHEYPVPNVPGKEKGKMRVIGESHKFQSVQRSYTMDCRDAGPDSLQLTSKSSIDLKAKPVISSNKPFGNQLCPTKVKFVATITAGSDFSGKAVFVGQSIADVKAKNFSIKKGQTKRVTRVSKLNWSAPPATTFATGGGVSAPLMSKNVMQSLNIVGSKSQDLILSFPRKAFTVSCNKASAQPGLQMPNGGFNTLPSHTGGGAPTDIQANQSATRPTIPVKPNSATKTTTKPKTKTKTKNKKSKGRNN